MQGLLIIGSERINGIDKAIGTFDGKPFELSWNAEEFSGEIDGDFDDLERMQILTVWDMQQ